MNEAVRHFRDFFVSLKLTVVLLALSIVLIFWGTLAQVNHGIWEVQQRFFQTFFVLHYFGDVPVPVFPGGYFIGGLLFINLISAHVYRFKLTWRKAGIFLTHVGLILLLLGELFTGLWQEVYQMRIAEGQTVNYSEHERNMELAIVDRTNPQSDTVTAIPAELLLDGDEIQHPSLPFRVAARAYYPNSALQMRSEAPNAPPSMATIGVGPQVNAIAIPVTNKMQERNTPAAFIELSGQGGPLGTWLVSPDLANSQAFSYNGREWAIFLRPERRYKPFALTLLQLRHDVYPGTNPPIPKNFSSRVRVVTPGGADDREVLISMNNPMRLSGLTFFQHQMDSANGITGLQVVRNPSWVLPYISCSLMGIGLLVQFGISLVGFLRRRRPAPVPARA